jgi:hypothetical protein
VFSGLDGPAIEKIGAANLRIHSEQNVVVETD